MLMRAAVTGIQHQRLLIVANSWPDLTLPPIGIADVVLDIGIGRVTQCREFERCDGAVPILCAQCPLAGLEIGIELRPVGIQCNRRHGGADRPGVGGGARLSRPYGHTERRRSRGPRTRRAYCIGGHAAHQYAEHYCQCDRADHRCLLDVMAAGRWARQPRDYFRAAPIVSSWRAYARATRISCRSVSALLARFTSLPK